MKYLLLVLFVLSTAACAREGAVRVLAPEELPQDVYASPTPSPTAAPPRSASLYFVRGDHLEPVTRVASGTADLADFVMRELLAGPSPEEFADGLVTSIPDGAELLAVQVNGPTATVNLSREFELSAEQRILVLRLGQVVYTLTDLARVASVRFLIDGEPVSVIGQDGETHEAVGRTDYSQLAAPSAGAPLDD